MNRFQNERHITEGILANLSGAVVALIWMSIDHMNIAEKSSHQFFTLSKLGGTDSCIQVVAHMQEEPEYHAPILYIPTENCYEGSIYVIDDGSTSVMCLPQER